MTESASEHFRLSTVHLAPSLAHPAVSDQEIADYYAREYGLTITAETIHDMRLSGESIEVDEQHA